MKTGSIETLVLILGRVLRPLENRLKAENALLLFEEMGGLFPQAVVQHTGVSAALNTASSAAGNLADSLSELESAIAADNSSDILASSILALADIALLLGSLSTLNSRLDAAAGSVGGTLEPVIRDFASNFSTRLLGHLLITSLETTQPAIAFLLPWTGLIERIPRDGVPGDSGQPPYIERRLHLDRFTRLLNDPAGLMQDVLGWGTGPMVPVAVLNALNDLLRQSGVTTTFSAGPPAQLSTFAFTLQADAPGIVLSAGLSVPGGLNIPWTINENWSLTLALTAALDSGLQISITPPASISFQPPAGTISGEARLELTGERAGDDAFILLGQTGGSRLQVGRVQVAAGVALSNTDVEPFLEFEINNGKAVIDTSSADGFIGSLMSGLQGESNFEIGGSWNPSHGVRLDGSATLEIALPVHVEIGPVEIQTLYFITGLKESGTIPIELSAGLGASLGPLAVSVERLGVSADVEFTDGDGNLGPVDLSLAFKPPNGVGLAIDAAVVKGGGYLYFDFDKEEYAGVLELDLSGIVSVKAIGLITTKMPDGSKGFSLLLIITAEFGSPIQLGFGFTLSGVGGLLGLNRTMRLEVIATGIRDGGINSIMFPQNVVANAPRIISDLKKYFPVEEGTFLIGPMVKIGWGTPNLVTVSLGIIIEIPGNIAILGVLKVALPDEDAALIVIQVSFIGAIEFDKKRLWFFASLFESRVLFIILEGEMGLLVGWGADANFVVSVGGFHPAFNPPPLPFGGIARIAISILNTDFARIRVEGYFAVTSNSVQFGAAVEIFFGVSAFNIDGHLAFDALFRFSPFYFIISISASLSVKVFGIGLFSVGFRGSLEGPTPWHVEGTGSISILFWDIDVDFSHTWGNEAETTLPPINVMPLLAAEYQKLENWRAVLPINNQLLVSLRSFEQGATDLVLHPVGSLKISQRAVPLELTIDKVGNQKPSDANRFSVTVSSTGIDKIGDIEESFAVGQYFAKADNELLNAKSFEPMKGGLELSEAGEQYHAPVAVKRVVRYEKIIIDTQYRRIFKHFFVWFGSLFSLYLNGNAVSKSALSHIQQKKLKPFADKVAVGKTLYTVAFNHDNSAFNANAMSFTSQVQAQEFMKQQIASNANLAKQLHVIPEVEMKRAA